MSRSVVYKCDRCGYILPVNSSDYPREGYILLNKSYARIADGDQTGELYEDLCEECFAQLRRFLLGRPVT